jgi:hypothetical protein
VQVAAETAIASGDVRDELKEVGNEGSCFSKEDLRQVQGYPSPRRGAGDLRKLET